jgi:hypothetical protein
METLIQFNAGQSGEAIIQNKQIRLVLADALQGGSRISSYRDKIAGLLREQVPEHFGVPLIILNDENHFRGSCFCHGSWFCVGLLGISPVTPEKRQDLFSGKYIIFSGFLPSF